jgi:hypothetical protein
LSRSGRVVWIGEPDSRIHADEASDEVRYNRVKSGDVSSGSFFAHVCSESRLLSEGGTKPFSLQELRHYFQGAWELRPSGLGD